LRQIKRFSTVAASLFFVQYFEISFMEDDLFNIIISLGGGFYVVVGYGQKLPFSMLSYFVLRGESELMFVNA
jgi:hypothetical protein